MQLFLVRARWGRMGRSDAEREIQRVADLARGGWREVVEIGERQARRIVPSASCAVSAVRVAEYSRWRALLRGAASDAHLFAIEEELLAGIGPMLVSMQGTIVRAHVPPRAEAEVSYDVGETYVERRFSSNERDELMLTVLQSLDEIPRWSKVGGFPCWVQEHDPSEYAARRLLLQLDLRELGATNEEYAFAFVEAGDHVDIVFDFA